MTTINLQTQAATRLHPADDVAIALRPLRPGARVTVEGGAVRLEDAIPPGHKFALRAIPAGAEIRRYGQVIGVATAPIAAGAHVHSHNLHVAEMRHDYAVGSEVRPVAPAAEQRTFAGYRRADGRAGTRNVVVVATTVNCAAHTARRLAERARATLLPRFPHVDNVVALTHGAGCGTRAGSPELDVLQRTIAGHVRHPNVGGALVVGLGCETNQFADLAGRQGLDGAGDGVPFIGIQDEGGVEPAVAAGLAALEPLLAAADRARRAPLPAAELVLALQCGGSDGFSGITANPALGLAADWLVAQGGTVVLAETPEIYGAEHLLTRRALTPAVAARLLERIAWWEHYTAQHGFEMDNNPAPGNKAGGLTTIYEKSLGAVAKAGSTPLAGVYGYAEPIDRRGFVFMDSPGYDPVSVTGQVAAGCTLIAFTTGRGSCFGCAVAPSLKIASNSATFDRMRGDMDVNAGTVVAGRPLATVAAEIVDLLLAVASGQPSKSEAQGIGEAEFDPWILGATL